MVVVVVAEAFVVVHFGFSGEALLSDAASMLSSLPPHQEPVGPLDLDYCSLSDAMIHFRRHTLVPKHKGFQCQS